MPSTHLDRPCTGVLPHVEFTYSASPPLFLRKYLGLYSGLHFTTFKYLGDSAEHTVSLAQLPGLTQGGAERLERRSQVSECVS